MPEQKSSKTIGEILLDLGIIWSEQHRIESSNGPDADVASCVLCGQRKLIEQYLGDGIGICHDCVRHWPLE